MMKEEESWIRERRVFRPKQLAWSGQKCLENVQVARKVEAFSTPSSSSPTKPIVVDDVGETGSSSSASNANSNKRICSDQTKSSEVASTRRNHPERKVENSQRSAAMASKQRPPWMNKDHNNGMQGATIGIKRNEDGFTTNGMNNEAKDINDNVREKDSVSIDKSFGRISFHKEDPSNVTKVSPEMDKKPAYSISPVVPEKNPVYSVSPTVSEKKPAYSVSPTVPEKPVKKLWAPPKSADVEIDIGEDAKAWTLPKSERDGIKLQLANVISARLNGSPPKEVDKVDESEQKKPQEDANQAGAKSKNITADTLKKILEMDKVDEVEEPHYNETSSVVKCGLPETSRPRESENRTDVEKCISQLLSNDASMKEVNLNNMKKTHPVMIQRLLEALKSNTTLKKLSLANMGLNDSTLEPLIEVLEVNQCLESLNLETNYLSGSFLSRVFQACLQLQTLHELKVVNQSLTLGHEAELAITKAIFHNRGFYKVSVDLRLPESRQKLDQTIIRNGELRRLKRKIEALPDTPDVQSQH